MTTSIYDLTGNTKDFAFACYNDNSIQELVSALSSDGCGTDREAWSIDHAQWVEAIAAALSEKIEDLESQISDLDVELECAQHNSSRGE